VPAQKAAVLIQKKIKQYVTPKCVKMNISKDSFKKVYKYIVIL
jgi:hypothetical protein